MLLQFEGCPGLDFPGLNTLSSAELSAALDLVVARHSGSAQRGPGVDGCDTEYCLPWFEVLFKGKGSSAKGMAFAKDLAKEMNCRVLFNRAHCESDCYEVVGCIDLDPDFWHQNPVPAYSRTARHAACCASPKKIKRQAIAAEHLALRHEPTPAAASGTPASPATPYESSLEALASNQGDESDDFLAWRDWLQATGRIDAIRKYLRATPNSGHFETIGSMMAALADLEKAGFKPNEITYAWVSEAVQHLACFPDCLASTTP